MTNGWTCSKCGKEPKIMHSTEPNICTDCYDKNEPGPPPSYAAGDRVTTPDGEGAVKYVLAGTDERSTSVCVLLDSGRHSPHYTGTCYVAEFVKPAPKRHRR